MQVIHECNFGNTQQIVTVDLETNWATGVANPDLSFPIYKDCCRFYEIKDDGSKGEELDFSKKHPILLNLERK